MGEHFDAWKDVFCFFFRIALAHHNGRAKPETIELGRVFSLPVEGVASGTWAETIFDDMLDEDIGLFLEANYLHAP